MPKVSRYKSTGTVRAEFIELQDNFASVQRTYKVFLHALNLDDRELQEILFECVRSWLECDIELIGIDIKSLKELLCDDSETNSDEDR